jgi:ribosomal protein L32
MPFTKPINKPMTKTMKKKEIKKIDICPKCGNSDWKNTTDQEHARLGPFQFDLCVYRECKNCGLKQQGNIF